MPGRTSIKDKIETGVLCTFSAWLVVGFAYGFIWLGLATGEFTSWGDEVLGGIFTGVVLFGWLFLFPLVRGRALWVRLVVGFLAAPGAELLGGAFLEEVRLVLAGRAHALPIAATYLASPGAYVFGYYLLARDALQSPELEK